MKSRRRLLGIDYGQVRLGLAISDPDRKIASPLTVYQRRDLAQDAAWFRDLVERQEIGGLVIGLPIHIDGREGKQAALVRDFGHWLSEVTGLPIVFWDERFTTALAEDLLGEAGLSHRRRRTRRDPVAAQIILQSYLDAGSGSNSAEPGSGGIHNPETH